MSIHKQDGEPGFTIGSGGLWLPGIYETERAARYAFRFPNEVLYRLNDRICRVDGENRMITFADLAEEKNSTAAATNRRARVAADPEEDQ